jgi:transcriptional regulator with XRE-family HTH domain
MLGHELKAAREGRGLSQQSLARLLDMAPGARRTIHRWETGRTPISKRTALAIRAVLGLDAE